MKRLLLILFLLLCGITISPPSAHAKIWSKNLITKATLSNGLLASICPTTLSVTEVLDPVVRMETDEVPTMKDSDCSGKDEEVLFGDITLTFKEGGEGKEYIMVYNDELLRADSTQYEYYKDWSLGALAPPNTDGKIYHGLKSVMADTLYKTDINVPDVQEKIPDSGFKTIYGKNGEIDQTYFVFKSKVYKVTKVKKTVTDTVLIDYTTSELSSTSTQPTNAVSPTTKLLSTDKISSWKSFSQLGVSFSYPDTYTDPRVNPTQDLIELISPLNPKRTGGYELQDGELKMEIYFASTIADDSLQIFYNNQKEQSQEIFPVNILEEKNVSLDGIPAIYQKNSIGEMYYLIHDNKRISIAKYPTKTTRQVEFDQIISTISFLK